MKSSLYVNPQFLFQFRRHKKHFKPFKNCQNNSHIYCGIVESKKGQIEETSQLIYEINPSISIAWKWKHQGSHVEVKWSFLFLSETMTIAENKTNWCRMSAGSSENSKHINVSYETLRPSTKLNVTIWKCLKYVRKPYNLSIKLKNYPIKKLIISKIVKNPFKIGQVFTKKK